MVLLRHWHCALPGCIRLLLFPEANVFSFTFCHSSRGTFGSSLNWMGKYSLTVAIVTRFHSLEKRAVIALRRTFEVKMLFLDECCSKSGRYFLSFELGSLTLAGESRWSTDWLIVTFSYKYLHHIYRKLKKMGFILPFFKFVFFLLGCCFPKGKMQARVFMYEKHKTQAK